MKRIVTVDKNLPVPIYYQIKEAILKRINSGELPPKTRLPSELELANANDVSPMTVRQAYTTLVNQGLLYRRHGKGTFVCEASPESAPPVEEKKSTDIGVLFTRYSSVMSFYSQMLFGIESACNAYSYHFHMIATNERGINSRENFIISSLLSSRQLDGLILAGPLSENEIHTIKGFGIPLVLVDNDYRKEEVVTVVTEDEKFMDAAVKKLLKAGRSKISVMTGPMSINPEVMPRRADKLLSAYALHMRKAGLPVRDEFVRICDSDEEAGYRAAYELLSTNEKPDAIIVNGDILVKSAVRAAEKLGLSIPGDVEILNYGDSDDSPCCLVSKPLFDMGKTAVELLRKMIKDDNIRQFRNIVPLRMPRR